MNRTKCVFYTDDIELYITFFKSLLLFLFEKKNIHSLILLFCCSTSLCETYFSIFSLKRCYCQNRYSLVQNETQIFMTILYILTSNRGSIKSYRQVHGSNVRILLFHSIWGLGKLSEYRINKTKSILGQS